MSQESDGRSAMGYHNVTFKGVHPKTHEAKRFQCVHNANKVAVIQIPPRQSLTFRQHLRPICLHKTSLTNFG